MELQLKPLKPETLVVRIPTSKRRLLHWVRTPVRCLLSLSMTRWRILRRFHSLPTPLTLRLMLLLPLPRLLQPQNPDRCP